MLQLAFGSLKTWDYFCLHSSLNSRLNGLSKRCPIEFKLFVLAMFCLKCLIVWNGCHWVGLPCITTDLIYLLRIYCCRDWTLEYTKCLWFIPYKMPCIFISLMIFSSAVVFCSFCRRKFLSHFIFVATV